MTGPSGKYVQGLGIVYNVIGLLWVVVVVQLVVYGARDGLNSSPMTWP